MNRQERRALLCMRRAALNKVERMAHHLDVTPAQLALLGAADGDIVTVQGFQRTKRGGVVRLVPNCPPGRETPMIVRVTP